MMPAVALAAAAAAAAIPLVTFAGAASATGNGLSYEVDNGASWTLSAEPSNLSAPVQGTSYADAGVVVDIGPVSKLNSSKPISWVGSGPLADNIWISNGHDEASTPGTHSLSSAVDFSYGFDDHDGTFYMASGPDAGPNVPFTQIQKDFAGDQAYAWVGVVSSNGSSVSGVVNSINGQNIGHRSVDVTVSNGVLTAAVN
jgi:hypothetical protein